MILMPTGITGVQETAHFPLGLLGTAPVKVPRVTRPLSQWG